MRRKRKSRGSGKFSFKIDICQLLTKFVNGKIEVCSGLGLRLFTDLFEEILNLQFLFDIQYFLEDIALLYGGWWPRRHLGGFWLRGSGAGLVPLNSHGFGRGLVEDGADIHGLIFELHVDQAMPLLVRAREPLLLLSFFLFYKLS